MFVVSGEVIGEDMIGFFLRFVSSVLRCQLDSICPAKDTAASMCSCTAHNKYTQNKQMNNSLADWVSSFSLDFIRFVHRMLFVQTRVHWISQFCTHG